MPIVWTASVSAWCENTPDVVIAMFVPKYSEGSFFSCFCTLGSR
jgi:hypothetical protein